MSPYFIEYHNIECGNNINILITFLRIFLYLFSTCYITVYWNWHNSWIVSHNWLPELATLAQRNYTESFCERDVTYLLLSHAAKQWTHVPSVFAFYQLGRRHRFVLQLNSAQWILSHLVSIHVSFVLLLIPGLPPEILTVLLLFGCSKCSMGSRVVFSLIQFSFFTQCVNRRRYGSFSCARSAAFEQTFWFPILSFFMNG